MRKHMFLTLLLCVALISGMIPIRSEAFERKDHDALILKILFRKYEYACDNSAVQDELSVLTSACYLTIDQFNSNGQKYLDELIMVLITFHPKSAKSVIPLLVKPIGVIAVCTLCCEHEKAGFVEGLKVGIMLEDELKK